MQAQFKQVNLVSDGFVGANVTDPNQVNPWGLAFSPTGPFWIANNGTGTSTVHNGEGTPFPPNNPLIVVVPGSSSPLRDVVSNPTGLVYNGGNGFQVERPQPSPTSAIGPSRFIFATEDGMLAGWAPSVDPKHAIVVVDTSADAVGTRAANYKGLAMANWVGGTYLYATNFSRGTVDVYNSNWRLVKRFTDPRMEKDFAPFGVIANRNFLYVSYAKKGPDGDDVAGAGNGFVDIFLPDGHLVKRLVSHGKLNSPWGMAFAPKTWGRFAGALLVGNFGDGTVNAYHRGSGHYMGTLTDASGHNIEIEGLWALAFGNGSLESDEDDLYFTAGIGDEEHGLFGEIERLAP